MVPPQQIAEFARHGPVVEAHEGALDCIIGIGHTLWPALQRLVGQGDEPGQELLPQPTAPCGPPVRNSRNAIVIEPGSESDMQ